MACCKCGERLLIFKPDTKCPCDIREAANFGERREGYSTDLLLLHYTGMENGEAAEDWLCREDSGVSCHYLVHEDGTVVQMVAEDKRAWHAGKSSWQGIADINSRSIGIEIVNPGHGENYQDFPGPQISTVIALSKDIIERHHIPAQHVLGHSDVAPGRKLDPGEKFPWQQLHKNGVGLWVSPAPAVFNGFFQIGDNGEPVAALQAMLSFYGYGVEISGNYDQATHDCIYAFQQHFRQEKVDGIADGATIATLDRLLRALP